MTEKSHALIEILANIADKDLIKARLVLEHFSSLESSERRRILFELSRAPADIALPLLVHLQEQDNDISAQYPTIRETIEQMALGDPETLARHARIPGPWQHAFLTLCERVRPSDATLSALNEAIGSTSAQIRNQAKSALTSLGAAAIPLLCANLHSEDPDIVIHSLNILQNIDLPEGAPAIRELLNSAPEDANIRFAAYDALGTISSRKGDYVLAYGLKDPDTMVRVAAARAVDHNLNPVLAHGIENLLEDQEECREMARTIIDAQAVRLFSALIDHEPFREAAFNYLSREVHPDTFDYFLQTLLANEHEQLALTLEELRAEHHTPQGALTIWAVDDSKMILNVYRRVLTELGHDCRVFAEPAQALEALESEAPELICTDLNMPEISGVELIRQARKLYPKERLPIIMVTTQNEKNDHNDAVKAGVNAIINKPFDPQSLRAAINEVTTR